MNITDLVPGGALINLVSTAGTKLIDAIFPDKIAQSAERDKAALALMQVQNDQEIKQVTSQLSAIIAEAQSTDPWTSRARPSFMYVIYLLLLFGIPMGILAAFRPDLTNNIANGFGLWLKAIPDSLYTLFGVGYLGYTGARTIEKARGVA